MSVDLASLPTHPERGWPVDPDTGIVYGVAKHATGRAIGHVGSHGYRVTYVRGRAFLMHRVVWETCVGPIPAGLVINHLNGVKLDNRLCNLEVVTCSENLRHARTTLGLRVGGAISGPRNSNYKITPQMRAGIWEMLDEGYTQTQIARAYGVSRKAIWIIEREER